MMKKNKKVRVFLETSGVIYHRHGHSLQKSAVDQAIANTSPQVSLFIRMEYLRGFVLNLIELYFLIKESNSVDDAIIDWAQKIMQERKLKVFLITMTQWLCGHSDWQDSLKSLRRLGELIVRLVREFDEYFPSRVRDRPSCRLGKLQFPNAAFREAVLLRFYERFKEIQESIPDCELCRFREWQQRYLSRQAIDLCSESQRHTHRDYKGYVAQAERLEAEVAKTDAHAKCRLCERLGDSIIVLQMPTKATLVTADLAFVPFTTILKREIRLLPSLQELKRQLNSEETTDR